MSVVTAIPLDRIRPFEGQPRTHFDEQALRELAESIRTHGQYTPAWVVKVGCEAGGCAWGNDAIHECQVPQQYELVAGERRWRACRLAGAATLLCEVREYPDPAARYLASVMENFGRKDCTAMETARSVGRIMSSNGGDAARTAAVFSRSTVWVRQMHSLNKLLPEVQAMLEPPDQSLSTQAGIALSNLVPETQLELAREISGRGLRHAQALALVRNRTTEAHKVDKRGRRRPSEDFDILKRLLSTLGAQTEAVRGLGDARLKGMLAHRDPKLRAAVRALLAKRAEQLTELGGML